MLVVVVFSQFFTHTTHDTHACVLREREIERELKKGATFNIAENIPTKFPLTCSYSYYAHASCSYNNEKSEASKNASRKKII